MHLAALKAMGNLLELLLDRGGNPNVLNVTHATCLHAVCMESNRDEYRRHLLEVLLSWRGSVDREGKGSESESVSVNRVDADGNTATHYAASNGLAECVIYLASQNAIISIVNLDQMTPCEMADSEGHVILADMLEIGLLFPPPEQDMVYFDDDRAMFLHEHSPPIFQLDARNYTISSVIAWKADIVESAVCALGLLPCRAETLLDYYAWDVEKMVSDFFVSPLDVMKAVKLESTYVVPTARYKLDDSDRRADDGGGGGGSIGEESEEGVSSRGMMEGAEVRSEEVDMKEGQEVCCIEVSVSKEVMDTEVAAQDAPLGDEVMSPLVTASLPPPPPPGHTTSTTTTKPVDSQHTVEEGGNGSGSGDAVGVHSSAAPPSSSPAVEYCGICSEVMEVCATSRLLEETGGEAAVECHWAVGCASGHVFCMECWRTHATMQVR